MKALFDKVKISSIQWSIVDEDKAREFGIIQYTVSGEKIELKETPTIKGMRRLSVGYSNFGQSYGILEIYVTGIDGNTTGHSKEQLMDDAERIAEQVEFEFGIHLNFDIAEFSYMEIQKTIVLSQEYNEYLRAFNFMMQYIPRMKVYQVTNTTFKGSTGKKGTVFTIYDKKEQMKTRFVMEENLCRFEIRLTDKQAINSAFETTYIDRIDDKSINDYYHNMIAKIQSKIETDKKKRLNEIKKILLEERANNCHWIVGTLRKISTAEITAKNHKPLALDVVEVLEVVDKLKINRKERIKESFRNECKNYEVFLHDRDDLKLCEVLQKLNE